MKGLLGWTVLGDFLVVLPAVVPAIFLGRYFNHRLRGERFFGYVYWGLVGIGVLLVVLTVMGVKG
ncbi:hypothetical protein ACQ86N_30685 [Puia sp. P3]|uniref:hypothetical protein n=1 Tax=Puia sp. P3 TaxID=3423952 RepID=UPI003D67248F